MRIDPSKSMRILSAGGVKSKNRDIFQPRKSSTIFQAAHSSKYRVFIDRPKGARKHPIRIVTDGVGIFIGV